MSTRSIRPVALKAPAKAAHVNMMVDSVILNMPPEGLRSIMRGLLGLDPTFTSKFLGLASDYLAKTEPANIPRLFTSNQPQEPTAALYELQGRLRCLMGCGYGFACLDDLCRIVEQACNLAWDVDHSQKLEATLASVDGDVVQGVTAVQKELLTGSGSRSMSSSELEIILRLQKVLLGCRETTKEHKKEFPFERGLSRLEKLDEIPKIIRTVEVSSAAAQTRGVHLPHDSVEKFYLGTTEVPRMFMGLWQFSSPAWGTASRSKINNDFRKHIDVGFTAYDMADHYGDAEVTFGRFRSSQVDPEKIFCATKYCVFEPVTLTRDVVEANITERLANIGSKTIDLLQLHWQSYDDHQYVKMAKLVEQDSRVLNVGLCNFDTQRMDEIVESGVEIVSNQVQFSLIDLRPTFKMAASCRKHNIKLLAYGSLCGGFLADKWLGQQAPSLFDENMTPSHRKYYEMINVWGGWALFQELLSALSAIGKKYSVSISNVASRWVLDHDYVGAVIIGARMGISEHTKENLQVFSFKLGTEDQSSILAILDRSKAADVFEAMGDCGAEYRQ